MKERQSNIELLRIISMLLVVLVHTNYFSLGEIGREDVLLSPFNSFWRMFTQQICVVGVNVFVLISGWFGIRPTVRGFCSLLFQILFYGVLALIVGMILGANIPLRESIKVFYFGSSYWFIISYLGLFILAPVLNRFVEIASQKEQLIVLLAFFGVEFLFGWLTDFGTYARGYSTISFIGLYLLARFIHSRYANIMSSKVSMALYLLFTLLTTFIAFFGYKYLGRGFSTFKYSSPFVIVSSVLLLLAFSNMTIKSKVINWIAVSVLSIYLVHQHPIVVPYFKSVMQWAHSNMGELYYSLFALGAAFAISISCIFVDKIRIAVWDWNSNIWLNKAVSSFEDKVSRLFERIGY